MTGMRAQCGVVVAGLVVMVGLTGCGGGGGRDEATVVVTSMPSSQASSTVETPGPEETDAGGLSAPELIVAPVMSELMATGDEAGARAAADYMLGLYTYTYWSGDVGPLQAFCDAGSTFCASVYDNVARRTANGERYVGGELSWVGEPQVTDQGIEYPAFEARGFTREAANMFVDSQGVPIERNPIESGETTMIVYFIDESWHLYDLVSNASVGPS